MGFVDYVKLLFIIARLASNKNTFFTIFGYFDKNHTIFKGLRQVLFAHMLKLVPIFWWVLIEWLKTQHLTLTLILTRHFSTQHVLQI